MALEQDSDHLIQQQKRKQKTRKENLERNMEKVTGSPVELSFRNSYSLSHGRF